MTKKEATPHLLYNAVLLEVFVKWLEPKWLRTYTYILKYRYTHIYIYI